MLYRTREAALAALDRMRQRGRAISGSVRRLEGTRYIVPSSDPAKQPYTVDMTRETCTCPAYREMNSSRSSRPSRCKHIWAVVYSAEEVAV